MIPGQTLISMECGGVALLARSAQLETRRFGNGLEEEACTVCKLFGFSGRSACMHTLHLLHAADMMPYRGGAQHVIMQTSCIRS